MQLFEQLNLTKTEDSSKDLKLSRIKKYGEHLETLITETMNPFSLDLNKEILFNISSGKAANKEVTSFLLYVTDIANRARKEFIEECTKQPKKVSGNDIETEDV